MSSTIIRGLHSVKPKYIIAAWVVAAIYVQRERIHAALAPMDQAVFDMRHGPRKAALLHSLQGEVLELGAGTGSNFRYLPKDVSYTGVERNEFCRPALVASAQAEGFPEATLKIAIQDMLEYLTQQDSDSLDAVLVTRALSSLDHHQRQQTLSHIMRVLKPGGRFYFVERTRQTNPVSRMLQTIYEPVFRVLSLGGERLSAPIAESIYTMGFSEVYMEAWPRSVDSHDARAGITLVEREHVGSSSERTATASQASPAAGEKNSIGTDPDDCQLSSLPGLAPIVAGVCVKPGKQVVEKEAKKEREVVQFGQRLALGWLKNS
eukprot:g65763.t1